MSDKNKDKGEKIFVGKRKVAQFVANEEIKLVAVKYTDGGTDEYTIEQWNSVRSPEQYPDTDVSRRKWAPAAEKMLQVLLDNNLRIYEKDFILNLVDTSIVENYNRAIAMMFGVSDPSQARVDQIDAILKQMKTPDNAEVAKVPATKPLPHPGEKHPAQAAPVKEEELSESTEIVETESEEKAEE